MAPRGLAGFMFRADTDTEEMYERAQRWMQERGLFDERGSIPAYASVVQA